MDLSKRLLRKAIVAVAMAAIALANLAFAVHVYEVNPLETPPTHWDEGSAWENDGNAVIDTRSGRLQSVSQLHEGPYSGTPEEAAWEFLSAHKDWLGMAPTKDGLQVARSAESPGGYHVTFERVINGVRVYPGNAVVSFDRDMYATFYFSSLYLFDNTVVTTPAISSSMAIQIAKSYVEPQTEAIFGPETDLVVWAIESEIVLKRPDVTILYYPSIYDFYWFAARVLSFLEKFSEEELKFPELLRTKEKFAKVLREKGVHHIVNLAKEEAETQRV